MSSSPKVFNNNIMASDSTDCKKKKKKNRFIHKLEVTDEMQKNPPPVQWSWMSNVIMQIKTVFLFSYQAVNMFISAVKLIF